MPVQERTPLRTSKLGTIPKSDPLHKYQFDPYSKWTDADQEWLELCLHMAKHWTDTHDPVNCERRKPGRRQRGDHDYLRRDWVLLREEAGYTSKDLAAHLGVDPSTITRWEKGERWPNHPAYFKWLQEESEAQAQKVAYALFNAQSKRDGWFQDEHAPDDPDLAHLRALEHWSVLYGTDDEGTITPGLYDRWIETGHLPAWSPRDAGPTRIPDDD